MRSAGDRGAVEKEHDGAAAERRGRERPPGGGDNEQRPWTVWAEILGRGTGAKEGGKGFRIWVRN